MFAQLGHARGVYSVTFSSDGRQVLSGSGDNTIKLWDTATGREVRTFSWYVNGVTSVTFNLDGNRFLSSSGDDTVKLWDAATGRRVQAFSGHTSYINSVTFSSNGNLVLSGSGDRTIKLWDVATGREVRTFSGHTGSVNSVTFSPDGRQVLSGSIDNAVKLWDVATGIQLRTFSGHTSGVSSVTFSHNGSLVLSGSYDGTVRLWDASTGREIAQFISFKDGEWAAITPDGYYNASPNGDKYINVRIGNNVYGIDQYRAAYYQPRIVEARLQGLADPVRVTASIQQASPPPLVVIRSPENGSLLTANQAELSVSVADQREAVKSIRVLVNGRLVGSDEMRNLSGTRGLSVENTGIAVAGSENRVDFRFTVTLSAGVNRIEVLASNQYSEGRDSVEVTYRQAASAQVILPNLWVLSIGVNRYDDSNLNNLNYAANDAREIINVFKQQEGRLYRSVNTMLVADGTALPPTRENIIDSFDFLRRAGQQDVVLLFIAGHGINDDGGNFYFMPSDAGFNADGSIRASRAISWREIQSVLDVPGQKLVFIDACHSEGTSGRRTRSADNNSLVRVLDDRSTVIFTSSQGSQLSQEDQRLGHGIFTYAILQGMRGAADLIQDKIITMDELRTYVSSEVPRLTNGLQHPTVHTPDGYVNFIMARMD